MERHPNAAALRGLVDGGLPADQLRAVAAHVLHGCRTCGRVLTRLALGGGSEIPLPPAADYDEALDRAFATVRAVLPRLTAFRWAERKKKEALALLASGGLEGLAAAPPDLRGPPLFEALLERSWAVRYEDPQQMVGLALCAALFADRLSEAEHGAREVAHLRCRAWVELANAYRMAGGLGLAETALERATELFVQGGHDDLLGARLFTVLASQYAARGSFGMARSPLGVVAEIYQRHGDRHLAGHVLIRQGSSPATGATPRRRAACSRQASPSSRKSTIVGW